MDCQKFINVKIFKMLVTMLTQILDQSETMRNALFGKAVIKSKRQPRNLKQILTRAKFTETDETDESENKVTKCRRSNCGLCPYIIEASEYMVNDKIIRVNTPMDFSVKNVVYMIQCRGCDEIYIGETNDLRKRMTVHRQQIRDKSTRMTYR